MRECLNNMKKYRIVAVFVMILLMGCGSAQNGKMKESSTMKESEETISIKTYDWNHARIKDMVDHTSLSKSLFPWSPDSSNKSLLLVRMFVSNDILKSSLPFSK